MLHTVIGIVKLKLTTTVKAINDYGDSECNKWHKSFSNFSFLLFFELFKNKVLFYTAKIVAKKWAKTVAVVTVSKREKKQNKTKQNKTKQNSNYKK